MSIFGFGFWRAVARKPDLALALLACEQDCLVNEERRPGFTGPFFVLDGMGISHTIYIRSESIQSVQNRVKMLLEVSG